MDFLSNYDPKDVMIILLILAFAGTEFVKVLLNRKNGCNVPEWFKAWEKRHDKIHDNIGGTVSEVKAEVKKVSEKLADVSDAVIRIDERTKNDKS